MLNKCANPNCLQQFEFLGKGKLFLANPDAVLAMSREEILDQCHWLCERCWNLYTIDFTSQGAMLTPLAPRFFF